MNNPSVWINLASIKQAPLILFAASFLIWLLVLTVIVAWKKYRLLSTRDLVHITLASSFSWLSSELVKYFIDSSRPFKINGYPPLTITVPTDHSFPSGHSAFAFAIATSVFLHHRKLGIVFFVAAIVIGVARVMGNVHFLLDVIGGAILGIFMALLFEGIVKRTK